MLWVFPDSERTTVRIRKKETVEKYEQEEEVPADERNSKIVDINTKGWKENISCVDGIVRRNFLIFCLV